MQKQLARAIIKEKLGKLSCDQKAIQDKIIFSNVLDSGLVKGNVCIYHSLPTEVDTRNLIDYYIDKCNLYLPVVRGQDIVCVAVDKNTKFCVGSFGIYEPIGKEISPDKIQLDICITPLLGYDTQKNRLGKGKGYYDRFFEKCMCLKVGLAYDQQLCETLDNQPHDIKMDYIITPKGIL